MITKRDSILYGNYCYEFYIFFSAIEGGDGEIAEDSRK